jgi:hypothetical protein
MQGNKQRRIYLPMNIDAKSEKGAMNKQSYEKPAIIYQERIEARAGVCSGGVPPKAVSASCGAPLTS